MSENTITEQTCNRCRQSIDQQFETNVRILNSHSDDIQDLKLIVSELKQLNAQQARALEFMEQRIRVLETGSPVKFWHSKSGERIIWSLIIITLMIVGAAIGRDLLPVLQQIK